MVVALMQLQASSLKKKIWRYASFVGGIKLVGWGWGVLVLFSTCKLFYLSSSCFKIF